MKKPSDFKIGDVIIIKGRKYVVSWITNYCLYFECGNAAKYEFLNEATK